MHCNRGIPHTLNLDQPIRKGWYQPFGGHVLYPIGSPTLTRLWLCNSLVIFYSIFYPMIWIGSSNGCPIGERGKAQSIISHGLKQTQISFIQRKVIQMQNISGHRHINTLRPRQNGRHFPDDIFRCIFLMKMCEFRLTFHWNLSSRVKLTKLQHWFR